MPSPLRAALLASWATAFLQGSAPLEQAVRAIEADDEPHLVVEAPMGAPDELGDILTSLRIEGLSGLRLALPVSGDPLGLTGPPEVNRAVLAVGEAAIGVAAPARPVRTTVPALVPDVRAFGSPSDQGHCVTWRVSQASTVPPDVPGLAQADRDLTTAMRETTQALSSVTIASWSSDAGDVAQRLRGSTQPLLLPQVAGPRAESLAQRAVRVSLIVDAARADDAGTLTAHSAALRAASLAPLDRAARRALVAAVGACHELAMR